METINMFLLLWLYGLLIAPDDSYNTKFIEENKQNTG